MKTKQSISVLLWVLLYPVVLFAVPACPDSILVTQPNGTQFWTRVHGDEFYNWRSTTDGCIILRDAQKCYRYAVVEGDSLVSSKIMVHDLHERTEEEKVFIKNNIDNVNRFVWAEQQVVAAERRKENITIERKSPVTTQIAVVGKNKRILTILIEFSDRPFTKTATDFDKLMNQESGTIEGNVCSVRNFYWEDSYGRLNVTSRVVGPFKANFKSGYYEREGGGSTQTSRELVREAIHRASESGVDFSDLDGDGDGYVDCIHIVFAGHGKSDGSEDGLIWEHRSSLVSPIIRDGKKAKDYIITPELYKDNRIAPIGTICHEFGHILGAPDFYDLETKTDTFYATGYYDLMADGSWGYSPTYINGHGRYPAHTNAYVKCYIWNVAVPVTLIGSTTKSYSLQPSTTSPVFYRIDAHTNGEFFLLENRVKQKSDVSIPKEGLIIYHIHKDLATSVAEWDPVNSQHPLQCYIVNASATQNPTADPNSYGKYNAYRAFSDKNKGRTTFTTRSTPSFTAWDGSGTGVDICFIKQNPDKSISFTVNPQIEGPDHLCGERTYSVTGTVPDRDTIVWSYATDIKFIRAFPVLKFPDGKQGASVNVARGAQLVQLVDSIGDRLPDSPVIMSVAENKIVGRSVWMPYTGKVTLAATVHSGNGTYRIEKEIELPQNKAPELDIPFAQKLVWFANQTRTFTEKGSPNIEGAYIKWYVKYPKDTVFTEYTGRSVSLTPTKAGVITIRVVNDCGCPTRNETTYTFDVLSTVQPPFIKMSYPNPVGASTLPIVVEQDHSGESDIAVQSIADNLPEYTIELWSDILGRVRTITSNEPRVELDIAGLPAGWYQLLLLQDGQLIDSGKVLIGQ